MYTCMYSESMTMKDDLGNVVIHVMRLQEEKSVALTHD